MDIESFLVGKKVGGGDSTTVEALSITQNGTTTAPSGKAYSPVTVNVANSYTASDEGKVVSSGALVAQTAHAKVTENGTIDTTLNNSVEIDVPTGGGGGSGVVADYRGLSYSYIDGNGIYRSSVNNNYYINMFHCEPGKRYQIILGYPTSTRFRCACYYGKTISDFESYIASPGTEAQLIYNPDLHAIADGNLSYVAVFQPTQDGEIAVVTSNESVAAVAYVVENIS